jgi:hypothetical protein
MWGEWRMSRPSFGVRRQAAAKSEAALDKKAAASRRGLGFVLILVFRPMGILGIL